MNLDFYLKIESCMNSSCYISDGLARLLPRLNVETHSMKKKCIRFSPNVVVGTLLFSQLLETRVGRIWWNKTTATTPVFHKSQISHRQQERVKPCCYNTYTPWAMTTRMSLSYTNTYELKNIAKVSCGGFFRHDKTTWGERRPFAFNQIYHPVVYRRWGRNLLTF